MILLRGEFHGKNYHNPENVVTEMLDWAWLMYIMNLVHRVDGFDIIVRNEQAAGQVVSFLVAEVVMSQLTLVCSDGMLSAAIAGAVFTSPTPDRKFWKLSRKQIKGLVSSWLFKNYSGDIMNLRWLKNWLKWKVSRLPVSLWTTILL